MGKGRQGDWQAIALDLCRAVRKAFAQLERQPPPPTPVIPTSPFTALAPARRSPRHTSASSSAAASSSVSTDEQGELTDAR
eukprot:23655-Eustigmatos_ZCMA.PRE.1